MRDEPPRDDVSWIFVALHHLLPRVCNFPNLPSTVRIMRVIAAGMLKSPRLDSRLIGRYASPSSPRPSTTMAVHEVPITLERLAQDPPQIYTASRSGKE